MVIFIAKISDGDYDSYYESILGISTKVNSLKTIIEKKYKKICKSKSSIGWKKFIPENEEDYSSTYSFFTKCTGRGSHPEYWIEEWEIK